ncbi:hypothetical protein D3C81_1842520 [compost metagenome]
MDHCLGAAIAHAAYDQSVSIHIRASEEEISGGSIDVVQLFLREVFGCRPGFIESDTDIPRKINDQRIISPVNRRLSSEEVGVLLVCLSTVVEKNRRLWHITVLSLQKAAWELITLVFHLHPLMGNLPRLRIKRLPEAFHTLLMKP